MKFLFASHPSVYTLPGTWEPQPDVMYDQTYLIAFGTTVGVTLGVIYLLLLEERENEFNYGTTQKNTTTSYQRESI